MSTTEQKKDIEATVEENGTLVLTFRHGEVRDENGRILGVRALGRF